MAEDKKQPEERTLNEKSAERIRNLVQAEPHYYKGKRLFYVIGRRDKLSSHDIYHFQDSTIDLCVDISGRVASLLRVRGPSAEIENVRYKEFLELFEQSL